MAVAKLVELKDDAFGFVKHIKDGLTNLVASMGTENDKRSYSHFTNNTRLSANGGRMELSAMYRTDWLSGKVVDIIPNDMCREWRTFTGDIEPERIKKLVAEEKRLTLSRSINMAHKWARLYGTAYVVMNVDDGQAPDIPLDISKIKPNGLKHIKVVDRHRMFHGDVQITQDPLNSNFGMPEYYRFAMNSVRIHHTRVLRFDGVQIPYDDFIQQAYCSDSVLDRLYSSIINLNTVTDSAASMVHETNVDVIKIKGLMNLLANETTELQLKKRLMLAQLMKSNNNTLLLDGDEEYEKKSNTFSGLPDLIQSYAQIVTAGADVPATRLLGVSSSGFNSTGEGDLKNYYDKIAADQQTEYTPRLDYFDKIMAKSLGIDSENEGLEYEFNSLFQMTPKEIAEIRFIDAQRDDLNLANGVVTELIIAKELQETGTYTNIDQDFIDELEAAAADDDLDGDLDNDDIKTNTGENKSAVASQTPKGENESGEPGAKSPSSTGTVQKEPA